MTDITLQPSDYLVNDEARFAHQVVQTLVDAGHEALWAGGCVRDLLLQRDPADYDVATSAHPKQIRKLFRRTLAIGAAFGVIDVLGPDNMQVQVATFRADEEYLDGRRPTGVRFTSAKEDALRRDFTINGMFLDPLTGKIHDFVGGQADLQLGMVRAIGDPHHRIEEDKLRMLRAVRFAARFGFSLEETTAKAVQQRAPQLTVVSVERIAAELQGMLCPPVRVNAVPMLHALGLWNIALPEWKLPGNSQGSSQPPSPTVWTSLNQMPSVHRVLETWPDTVSWPLVLATLTALIHPDQAHRVGESLADRLRCSNPQRDRVRWLLANRRVVFEAQNVGLALLKRTLAEPGARELLHLAQALSAFEPLENQQAHVPALRHYQQCLENWSADQINPPTLITGSDLIALGLQPGPQFKTLLETIRDHQLEGTISTKDEALEFLKTQQ